MSIYDKIKNMSVDEMSKFFFGELCRLAEVELGVDADINEKTIKFWLKGEAQ